MVKTLNPNIQIFCDSSEEEKVSQLESLCCYWAAKFMMCVVFLPTRSVPQAASWRTTV